MATMFKAGKALFRCPKSFLHAPYLSLSSSHKPSSWSYSRTEWYEPTKAGREAESREDDGAERARETMSEGVEEAKGKAEEMKERTKEYASSMAEKAKEGTSKAAESAKEPKRRRLSRVGGAKDDDDEDERGKGKPRMWP